MAHWCDINLLKFEHEKRNKETLVLYSIVLVTSLFFIGSIAYFSKVYQVGLIQENIIILQKNKAEMSRNFTNTVNELKSVRQEQKMQEKANQNANELLKNFNNTINWSKVITQISSAVPKNIWLVSLNSRSFTDELEVKQKEITFSGYAFKNEDIVEMIAGLEASDEFYDVRLAYVKKRSRKFKYRLDYEIKTLLYLESVSSDILSVDSLGLKNK